jgi:hypothetical protein
MLCILRVGGDDLNRDGVVATMGSPPYREDTGDPGSARIACLHYEVAESNERLILIERIRGYLEDNHSRLQLWSGIRGVQVKDLDIGLLLDDEKVSLTIGLGVELVRHAAQLGLSITVSVYKVGERSA